MNITLTQAAKNIALSLFVLLLLSGKASAQLDNLCIFKETTATYIPLGDEVDITSTVFIPDSFYTVTAVLGDTYPLMGQPWLIDTINRALFIMANGRVYLGLDTGFAIFDCMYSDSIKLIDNTSKVSYWITGTGNQEILKIQWKNLKIGSGPAGNYFNVQMWLYKETGVIEYRYGPRSANNASGYTDPVTGIYVGIWYSTNNFSTMYEKIQVKGTPPNIQIDSNLNLNVPNIQGVPAEGTVYRFVPKAVATSVAQLHNDHNINISPNPATDNVNIHLTLSAEEEIGVTIVNALGSIAYEQSKQLLEKGDHSLNISTLGLAAGIYYVRISGNGGEQVRQLSIVK
jgi:hypothetical protein